MDIETRLCRLEERLTWLNKHAVEQDRVISAQSFEIEALKHKIEAMKKQTADSSQSDNSTTDERPPHY